MDKEAMREFVREKCEEWGWHSHKEHNAFMKGLDKEPETTTGEAARKELERFIKKNKVEAKEVLYTSVGDGIFFDIRCHPCGPQVQ